MDLFARSNWASAELDKEFANREIDEKSMTPKNTKVWDAGGIPALWPFCFCCLSSSLCDLTPDLDSFRYFAPPATHQMPSNTKAVLLVVEELTRIVCPHFHFHPLLFWDFLSLTNSVYPPRQQRSEGSLNYVSWNAGRYEKRTSFLYVPPSKLCIFLSPSSPQTRHAHSWGMQPVYPKAGLAP